MDEIDLEFQKYLDKLEILKAQNNYDQISLFFLNTWKRKFQERKDKEALKSEGDKVIDKEKATVIDNDKSKFLLIIKLSQNVN